MCQQTKKGTEYEGTNDTTTTGTKCQKWLTVKQNSPSLSWPIDFDWQMANSYCRNPSGMKDTLWCYTSKNGDTWEYCDVPICGKYNFIENIYHIKVIFFLLYSC